MGGIYYLCRMSKRADEKVFSIWWFVSLALVGAAIVISLIAYFGAMVDVREQDASMLSEKIKDCVIDKGFLRNVSDWTNEDFFRECGMYEHHFSEESKIFFELKIFDKENKLVKNIFSGDVNYREHCDLNLPARDFPVCIKSKDAVLFFNENTLVREGGWRIELLVASNYYGRAIPINE